MSKRSETVELLIRKAQEGDRNALDELVALLRPDVERHVRSLLSKFRSYKVHCDPDDVIHAVWEDFLSSFHKFRDGDFELWFARRRRNRVLDRIRKEVRTSDNLENYARSNPHPPVSSDPVKRIQTRKLLEHIDGLPPRQKAVITLYHGKGWTFRESGDFLEIKPTSVGSLHARALKKLKKMLRD
jgi:RNA polymerase sigma factor (sigma-70 family)